ncbi:Detected protein of unknown function [Hibiscus syriacus]|uniref:Uncharacterized protein n=1 Tax=Hibiscus syriacus TaxID=106335 RepID=A0A6A3CP24_HIBSY|nr:Detected protein of unknown function [Hibiscus syriacus]
MGLSAEYNHPIKASSRTVQKQERLQLQECIFLASLSIAWIKQSTHLKRVELSKFETEYREVLTQFTEMTSRYTKGMQEIDELLKQRNEMHASYTTVPPRKRSSSKNWRKGASKETKKDGEVKERKHSTRDRTKKKKWYNIHLKFDKRKQLC